MAHPDADGTAPAVIDPPVPAGGSDDTSADDTSADDAVAGDTDAAKHERIIDAATALFAAHGYAAVSMDDVAHAAGVGVGDVERAVGSKEDLYVGVFERLQVREWRVLEEAIRSHLGEDALGDGQSAVSGFLSILDDYLDFLVGEPHLAPLWIRRNLDTRARVDELWRRYALPQFAIVLDRLQTAEEAGAIDPIDPELVLRTVAWVTHCYLAARLPDIAGPVDPREPVRLAQFRRYLHRLVALALTGAVEAEEMVKDRR